MDEPDGERRKKQVIPKKAVSHEGVLGLNTAVTSLGDRKPLAPIENPMDLSFGKYVSYQQKMVYKA